ncbi:MAG: protein translocase subunit SecF [Candidatus Paceibacterota bacterium]
MKPVYKIFFYISMALTVMAVVLVIVFGLRLGVDFKGGSVLEVSFDSARPSVQELNDTVREVAGVGDVNISPAGDTGALLRMGEIDEETHQAVLQAVSAKYGEITENRFDSVGPTIGNELRGKSITAIIVLLLVVIIYIAIVFRKLSGVLSPWAMGFAAIAALIHDVIVPIGLFAYLGHYFGVEITAVFVAAALTILGYSIADSVVIFDRVRENILRFGVKDKFAEVVHKSVLQTLVRSINTTLTTLIPLAAIFFFGGDSIKYFALALMVGIFSGSYSSIFIASPILVWLSGRRHR